jgi:uncharacterized membrane protein YqjE
MGRLKPGAPFFLSNQQRLVDALVESPISRGAGSGACLPLGSVPILRENRISARGCAKMNETRSAANSSWSEALKRFSAVLMQGLDYRLDLLILEFQEEKQRLLGVLFLAMIAAFAALLGFLCINLLVVMLFWETHRVLVVVLMCVFYIATALSIVMWLRHRLRSEPDPFSASRSELRKDLSLLEGDEK